MEGKKMDLITMSARKNSCEWPVLNQIRQLRPWGVVQNRGRSVGGDRGEGRWKEKKNESEETAVRAGVGVAGSVGSVRTNKANEKRCLKKRVIKRYGATRKEAHKTVKIKTKRLPPGPLPQKILSRKSRRLAQIVDGLVEKYTYSSILICCQIQYIKAT